ncbi:MAG: hypothetical protein IJI45_00470, partial [Anaerolineaceae bacterium]|nr:hypothetical protein [Anaerolineaceae bacterium]
LAIVTVRIRFPKQKSTQSKKKMLQGSQDLVRVRTAARIFQQVRVSVWLAEQRLTAISPVTVRLEVLHVALHLRNRLDRRQPLRFRGKSKTIFPYFQIP